MAARKPPSVTRALAASLKVAGTRPADAGAVSLARQYAAAIDHASVLAGIAQELLEEAAGDDDLTRRVAVLAQQVEVQVVLRDLGPRLLACLVELKMTTKAATGGGTGDSLGATVDALDELRARRSSREDRAADLDPTTS